VDVVAKTGDKRTPHLCLIADSSRDQRLLGRVRIEGDSDDAGNTLVGGRRGREVEVDDQQRLLELRRSSKHPAGGINHDGVTVEDELILSAEHVDVSQRAPSLPRPPGTQLKTHIILVSLIGRSVDHNQQACSGIPNAGYRSTVLPEVLADRQRDIDAVDTYDT